jgi:GT2 family glycosyltransferase
MKIITSNWLDKLCTEAKQDNVGIVGAQLLFADESIQHAGFVLGMRGFAEHLHRFDFSTNDNCPFISPNYTREVMAVTGACHVIESEKFHKIGGYDEKFIVCGSDVEICLRLNKNRYKTIYDGSVKLYHYESKTRDGKKVHYEDNFRLYRHILAYIFTYDPFYNKNLDYKKITPTLKKSHI